MANFLVMLRVKDGIFFLNEWLACFEKIADSIVVLDNGSTDGTYEVLSAHPKVKSITRTEGFNEGRDKNLMYNEARKLKPDWLLWVDVDEIFEPGLTRKHFDKLMKNPATNKYGFRRFHFIDKKNFAGSWFRLNYTSGHDRIMWRENPKGHFENLLIDSPNVKGIKGFVWRTNFRLKHLGYINKDIVDKKAGLYRSIIPDKEKIFQEMYMRDEKKIKWNDNRNSLDVIMMNWLLNGILITHAYWKVYFKIHGLFTSKRAMPVKLSEENKQTENSTKKVASY